MCVRSSASPGAPCLLGCVRWSHRVCPDHRRCLSAESILIGGVMGEWNLAEAIWSVLRTNPGFNEVYAEKEFLCVRPEFTSSRVTRSPHVLNLVVATSSNGVGTRRTTPKRHPVAWDAAEREVLFRRNAEARRWWGYFEDAVLLADGRAQRCLQQLGQVWRLHVPDRRGLGLSRTTMNALLCRLGRSAWVESDSSCSPARTITLLVTFMRRWLLAIGHFCAARV